MICNVHMAQPLRRRLSIPSLARLCTPEYQIPRFCGQETSGEAVTHLFPLVPCDPSGSIDNIYTGVGWSTVSRTTTSYIVWVSLPPCLGFNQEMPRFQHRLGGELSYRLRGQIENHVPITPGDEKVESHSDTDFLFGKC